MGSFFGGGPKGPSAEDLARQRALQEEQQRLIAEQRAQLERQRVEAEEAASQLEADREREAAALRRRNRGRSSLIQTSELGVTDNLG